MSLPSCTCEPAHSSPGRLQFRRRNLQELELGVLAGQQLGDAATGLDFHLVVCLWDYLTFTTVSRLDRPEMGKNSCGCQTTVTQEPSEVAYRHLNRDTGRDAT